MQSLQIYIQWVVIIALSCQNLQYIITGNLLLLYSELPIIVIPNIH